MADISVAAKDTKTVKDFPGSRFIGIFELVSQENFYDDYLSAVGNNI